MGRRKDRARTQDLWIPTNALPATGGHPFYQRLNQVLDQHAFDASASPLARCRSSITSPSTDALVKHRAWRPDMVNRSQKRSSSGSGVPVIAIATAKKMEVNSIPRLCGSRARQKHLFVPIDDGRFAANERKCPTDSRVVRAAGGFRISRGAGAHSQRERPRLCPSRQDLRDWRTGADVVLKHFNVNHQCGFIVGGPLHHV
jgi:hypothetical protein